MCTLLWFENYDLIDFFNRHKGAGRARMSRLTAATTLASRTTWPSVLWRIARRGARGIP
jgi:hypothetical protein